MFRLSTFAYHLSVRTFRVPPIAVLAVLIGLAAFWLYVRYESRPSVDVPPPDPFELQVRAFFDAISPEEPHTHSSLTAHLLTLLYGFPVERLHIMDHRLTAIQVIDPDWQVSVSSVLAHDIGTDAAVKLDTRLYWHRDTPGSAELWRLDVDESIIDALTAGLLEAVRDKGSEAAAVYLPPGGRTAERGRLLVSRYNWLDDLEPMTRDFDVMLVVQEPDGSRAVSYAMWRHTGSEKTGRVEIHWIRIDGTWHVDLR